MRHAGRDRYAGDLPHLGPRFACLRLERTAGRDVAAYPATSDGVVITRLEGELLDQAVLAGVINTLFELQVPLLAVKRVPTGR